MEVGEEPGEVVDGVDEEVGGVDRGEEDQQHQDEEEALGMEEEDEEGQEILTSCLREVSSVYLYRCRP